MSEQLCVWGSWGRVSNGSKRGFIGCQHQRIISMHDLREQASWFGTTGLALCGAAVTTNATGPNGRDKQQCATMEPCCTLFALCQPRGSFASLGEGMTRVRTASVMLLSAGQPFMGFR